nr:MAG TPA: hypothetical protein [Caudoviricetes sp.]
MLAGLQPIINTSWYPSLLGTGPLLLKGLVLSFMVRLKPTFKLNVFRFNYNYIIGP